MLDLKQLKMSFPICSVFFFQNLRVESSPQDGVRILAGGLSLVLQSISRRNTGNYSCIGYNLEGEDTSNSISINVKCKYQLSN